MSTTFYVSFHTSSRDPEHVKKVRAVKALAEAGINRMPPELEAYFGCKYTDDDIDQIASVDVIYSNRDDPTWVSRFFDHGNEIEIDLDALPSHVKKIKVGCR